MRNDHHSPDGSGDPHGVLLASPTWQAPPPPLATHPQIPSSPTQRQISLKLISSESETNCHFWVGLTKHGPLSPVELLKEPSLADVFAKAATTGLSDNGPVMLSDSQVSPPRFIYLLPPPTGEAVAEEKWLHLLQAAMQAWTPKALGFYLAPELLSTDEALTLLRSILARMMRAGIGGEYYLLLGAHGLTSLLSTSLQLKADLRPSQIELLVFH